MIQVPIQSIPNQSLSIQLDNNLYDLNIKECNGIMSVDIILNNSVILYGQRAVPGFPIIPYTYLQETGNFIFITANDDYPYYSQFGTSQYLIYASNAEIAAL